MQVLVGLEASAYPAPSNPTSEQLKPSPLARLVECDDGSLMFVTG